MPWVHDHITTLVTHHKASLGSCVKNAEDYGKAMDKTSDISSERHAKVAIRADCAAKGSNSDRSTTRNGQEVKGAKKLDPYQAS